MDEGLFAAASGRTHRVLVISPPHVARNLIPQIMLTGARVVAAPTLSTRPLPDQHTLDQAIRTNCDGFGWVVFRSGGCVSIFLMLCSQCGLLPAVVLESTKVAVLSKAAHQLLQLHRVKIARVRSLSHSGASFGVVPNANATRVDLPGAENQRVLFLAPRLEGVSAPMMVLQEDAGTEVVHVETYAVSPFCAEEIGLAELGWLREGSIDTVAASSPAEVEALLEALAGCGWQLLEPLEHDGCVAYRLVTQADGIGFCDQAGRQLWTVSYSSLQGWPIEGDTMTLMFVEEQPGCTVSLSQAAAVGSEMQSRVDALAAEAGKRMVEQMMGITPPTDSSTTRSVVKQSAGLASIKLACVGEDTAECARRNGLNVVAVASDELECGTLLSQIFSV